MYQHHFWDRKSNMDMNECPFDDDIYFLSDIYSHRPYELLYCSTLQAVFFLVFSHDHVLLSQTSLMRNDGLPFHSSESDFIPPPVNVYSCSVANVRWFTQCTHNIHTRS